MSPEQAQREHAEAVAALQAVGPAALDGWRMIVETLNGMVALTVELGWPREQARELVAAQFQANLRAATAAVDGQRG